MRTSQRLTRERERGRWHAAPDPREWSGYARLRARLVSMPVIEQAKGIIMAQCGCDDGQAFELLRWASQQFNQPVRELAAEIVARVQQQPSGVTGAARAPLSAWIGVPAERSRT